MLLRILLVYIWKHLFYPWVICWLNDHHCTVFNTSMSLMMILQIYSIVTVLWPILFQTLSHVEGLLTIDSYSCRCIRLDVCHIEPSTIWWLAALIINSYSTDLCWVVHLLYRHCTGFSIAFVRFNKADSEIILDVITWDWVCCRPNSLSILLQLLRLSSNRICSFSINPFDLFNLLRLLWCTEFYFPVSRFRRSLRSRSVEEPTSNHCSLVHYQLWREAPNNSI
jgi:hypothetical protein